MTAQFDITTAPLDELMKDLRESMDDLQVCWIAIRNEIDYPDLHHRFLVNAKIIADIETELIRREMLEPAPAIDLEKEHGDE